MKDQQRIRFRSGYFVLAAVILALPFRPADGQHVPPWTTDTDQTFLPDDPLWEDPDRIDAPVPARQRITSAYDMVANVARPLGSYWGPALNVNTLDEVPNSSWYQNRHYLHPMTIDELKRGPDASGGPSMEGPWRVVSGKSEGKSAGMQIVDARGDRYLLKFDPTGHIEISSGAEVVSTRFFYAFGYHVPENYIARFPRGQLVLDEEATFDAPDGTEVPMTEANLADVLAIVPTYPDGTYRAMASRWLAGRPLGPFHYYGTRPDDANDLFPHEGRRELRGLRIFSSWLNHTDVRSVNTLDMLVEEDGRSYVRHHLLDFGSTIGGGPIGLKHRWDGYEYVLEPDRILGRILTLGLGGLGWAGIRYTEFPSIGRFEADHFEPTEWRPQYPNPAFRRQDAADAFWAAKQLQNLSDDEIRAVVETGEYSNPDAEAYLVETLVKRRDRIGRAYLDFGGGLDRFAVEDGRLLFVDLPARHGFAVEGRVRRVEWAVFDNISGTIGQRLGERETSDTSLDLPPGDHPYLAFTLHTTGSGKTEVYLRRGDSDYEVVGVRRDFTSPLPPSRSAP